MKRVAHPNSTGSPQVTDNDSDHFLFLAEGRLKFKELQSLSSGNALRYSAPLQKILKHHRMFAF